MYEMGSQRNAERVCVCGGKKEGLVNSELGKIYSTPVPNPGRGKQMLI